MEDMGSIPTGNKYRMRKLRYEVVPGLYTTAVLYEPENMKGRIPAILNVNGHVGAPGKAVEYKQKRCINFALRGILALNLEWIGHGELLQKENYHWYAGHLDLVGLNGVGLFYLAMRKGLDYLYDHPNVDRNKLGVTGLSGGGWQTIVLSALDERVTVSVPVAGFASFISNLATRADFSDNEQQPTDLVVTADYAHFVAMRAPRPTLLIYNAEDDCCFRAPLVKPLVYDQIRQYFQLDNHEDNLAWHENTDPGTHNYQLDNRQQAYRFFTKHFDLPIAENEIPVDAEIKSEEEMRVGLPADNLTILGLARVVASQIQRQAVPTDSTSKERWSAAEQSALQKIVRYEPLKVTRAWAVGNTKNKGLESISYRFDLSNGIGATAISFKAITVPDGAPVTIVLNDGGKKAAGEEISDNVNRGEHVLAVDLLLSGDIVPPDDPARFALAVNTVGSRPLGIRAAQLIGISNWFKHLTGASRIRLDSRGIRSQVTAQVAAALAPSLFSELVIREGMQSFQHLLDAPVEFPAAPELFCLDLYKNFDLDELDKLAPGVRVVKR
jgi:dienelactone hydrolase